MYRFFKKYSVAELLLAGMLLISINSAYATESFTLRPVRMPLFNRLSRLLERAQRSCLLLRADALLAFAGIFELAAAAGSPKIVVLPPVGTNDGTEAAGASVKVLSANLLLFPFPFFFNQQERIDEFTKIVRELNPDIILIQEVWDNRSLGLLIAAFPDYYSIYSPGAGYNYSGLLTLSRFSPKTATVRRFATSLRHSLEEFIAQKAILQIELTTGEKPLHLINTHLYSAAPDRSYRPNLDQFRLLAEIAGKIAGRIIVGGDMNLRPEDITALMPANLQSEGCSLPTAGYPDLSQKLDYIMAGNTDGQTVISGRRVDPARRFSDHNPVFAEIEFHD
jgi:exonuclease III